MSEPVTMVQAAYIMANGGKEADLGEWAARFPKKAIALKFFVDYAKRGVGRTKVGHVVEGFAEIFEALELEVKSKILVVLETAMFTMAHGENPADRDLCVQTILEFCSPADMFVANNDLLLVEKFRVAVREAFLDMGDRPAGDVTLENVMRSALKLIAERQVDKALKQEDL